jgi:hypothetical protein
MKRSRSFPVLVIATLTVLGLSTPAQAEHRDRPRTENIHPLGHIEEPRSLLGGADGTANTNIHTDIAFWGDYAYQGNWDGFSIRDISSPGHPRAVSHTSCEGNQGDVVVYDDVLVRSWNDPAEEGLTCDGEPVPAGFQGLHVFDISDPQDPELEGAVATRCGSHTATAVPDKERERLLVYSSPSDDECPGIDIVEIPLDDAEDAAHLRFEPAGRPCHDTGVILGDAMLAACAGGDGYTMWHLSGPGSLLNPHEVQSVSIPGVTIGHSAVFTWDGKVLVFTHEPGGGVEAACLETTPEIDRTAFFFDTATGDELGRFVFERFQRPTENCVALHNFNVVPLRSNRYVLVHGSYQAGTGAIDFTDPGNPVEFAWSDPPPEPVPPGSPFGLELGGAWSSYWYDGFVYETQITEGLNIFRLSGPKVGGAIHLGHLNPQTQEFTTSGEHHG